MWWEGSVNVSGSLQRQFNEGYFPVVFTAVLALQQSTNPLLHEILFEYLKNFSKTTLVKGIPVDYMLPINLHCKDIYQTLVSAIHNLDNNNGEIVPR